LAQVEGGVIEALAGGVGPEVEGVAGLAALEAVEGVLLQSWRRSIGWCPT